MALAVVTLPLVAPRALHAVASAQAAIPPLDPAIQVSASIERHAGPLFTERPAQIIRVAPGDTLESLGTTFHVAAGTLRWANSVRDVSEPVAGTQLTVPPGNGVLVRVPRAETPSRFASDLNIDPRVLLDYNPLSDDGPLPAGAYVQVPRTLAPETGLDNSVVVPQAPFTPMVPSTQASNGHDNAFPYGQCTYFVASRRHVTWAGNAGVWYGAAHAAGRPVGHVPVAGAIAVIASGYVGHVAYVERVNPDGSFVVGEWNVMGWATYDERTLQNGSPVVGFIY